MSSQKSNNYRLRITLAFTMNIAQLRNKCISAIAGNKDSCSIRIRSITRNLLGLYAASHAYKPIGQPNTRLLLAFPKALWLLSVEGEAPCEELFQLKQIPCPNYPSSATPLKLHYMLPTTIFSRSPPMKKDGSTLGFHVATLSHASASPTGKMVSPL